MSAALGHRQVSWCDNVIDSLISTKFNVCKVITMKQLAILMLPGGESVTVKKI